MAPVKSICFSDMRTIILIATCLLALGSMPSIQGSQIYLQSLEIATTHDTRTKPSVYLRCKVGNGSNDGNRTFLPKVKETNKIYTFDKDLAVVSVEANECATCTLTEQDRNAKDDVFGAVDLCHAKIAKTSKKQLSVLHIGEFHAVFSCPDCTNTKAPPQPLAPGNMSPSLVPPQPPVSNASPPAPRLPAQVLAKSPGEGSPVYLQSLEIATTHDRITKPSVYLTCKVGNSTSDEITTEFPMVKAASKIYSFVAAHIEVVSLKANECATCTLREHDRNSKDDVFGNVELCSDKIARTRKHRLSVLEIDEFHAVFSCPNCTAGSSPLPSSPPSSSPMPSHHEVSAHPASKDAVSAQPASEDDVPPSLRWRFITGDWPLTTDNTTWGVVTVQSFSSNDCTGNPLVLDEVSYGGGNWSFARDADIHGLGKLGEGLSQIYNQADTPSGDHGIEVHSAAEADDDVALYFYTSSLDGPQQYKVMPSMSCKDENTEHMHTTTMLGCSEMCNLLKQCRAYTFNTETKSCFLKKECLKLRHDRQRTDVSAIKISNVDKATTLPDHEDYLVEAVVGQKEAELMAKMDHWGNATNQVQDSPSGGSYISLKLAEPGVVKCMRFVVPPALKANFPQAARIQYSTDDGASWVTSQGIEPVGQETLLVKTVSNSVNVTKLEAQLIAALQPDSAIAKLDETFAHAIEAAMNAVKDASRGVNFSNQATGFFFTVGMMAVGFVLACGCTYCCKRRKEHRRKAYEDSFRTPAEGGEFLSDIELGSSPDKSLIQPIAGLVHNSIDNIKSTLAATPSTRDLLNLPAKKGKNKEHL